jgi:hypothetical protein
MIASALSRPPNRGRAIRVMPLQANAIKRTPFLFVFAAILTAGLVGSLVMLKRLLPGSIAPAHIIPAGTVLVVHLNHPLTSRTAQLGDWFQARLEAVKGAVGIPSNSLVEGKCLAARKARRDRSGGYLRLGLSRLRDPRGHKLQIQTTTLSRWGGRLHGTDTSLEAVLRSAERDSGLQPAQESGSPEAVVNPEERLSFVLIEPLVLTEQSGHF